MDIDIDLRSDFKLERVFSNAVPASTVEDKDGVKELKRHIVGAYFQTIPKDPISGLAAIPYEEAEELGYLKIDFLNLSLLQHFESKDEVHYFSRKEPNWKLLEDREFVEKLFHVSKHYDMVNKVKPTSILELADILALIRPGKTILLDKYLKNKKLVRKELYTKRQVSDLRKSHALAYAVNIVINMNLLEAKII
jgi:DNA polymerase III alpha subunit